MAQQNNHLHAVNRMFDDEDRRSIDLTARFWQKDIFKPQPMSRTPWGIFRLRRLRRMAAVAATAVVLSATAAIIGYSYHSTPASSIPTDTPEISENTDLITLEFTDTPLPQVITAIESAGHISVRGNIPADCIVTLSYTGTAEDLIETLNGMFGISLEAVPAE